MALAAKTNARTPLTIGWEAAKANAIPAFILQALMLALLIGYYFNPSFARMLETFAELRQRHGLTFVIFAAVLAGGIVPEIFLIFFFSAAKFARRIFAISPSPFRPGAWMGFWLIACIA